MALNELETLCLRTKFIGLSKEKSLQYLEDRGHKICAPTYYKTLAKISVETLKNLHQIASNFKESFLEEMQEIDEIKKLMWEQFIECDDPIKKVSILNSIVAIKPYKSAYLEASRRMLERYAEDESSFEKSLDFTNS